MRTENTQRIVDTGITKFNMEYLHYKPFQRDLMAAIKNYAKGKVLDIGCGNKPYEKEFGHQISEYVGCDIMQSHLNKVDILCEANNIPLQTSSFDTVFSTQTIEHVEDHQGLINEAYRLLIPSGYFIIAAPFIWPLHEEPYDFFRFTKHGFKFILEKAGFEMIEIKSNGGMWAATGQSINHSFKNSESNHFFIRVSRFLFHRLRIYWLLNSFFSWMDKVDYNPMNTINYVAVAKKTAITG